MQLELKISFSVEMPLCIQSLDKNGAPPERISLLCQIGVIHLKYSSGRRCCYVLLQNIIIRMF